MVFLLGSIVVSDCWTVYNRISQLGYEHLTVNHRLHFVDLVTRVNTNWVENLWMRAERRNKGEFGTERQHLSSQFFRLSDLFFFA
jgi:hypothetical protein